MASLESPFWIHLGSGSLTKTLTEWVTYSSYTVELIKWTTALAGKADTCQLSVSFTGTFYGIDEELCIVILIDLVFCIRFFNLLRVNHRNRLYCSKVLIVHWHFPLLLWIQTEQSASDRKVEDICNVMCTHDISVRPSWYDLILHHPPDSWCWQNTVVHLRDPWGWDHNYVSKQIGIYASWGDYVFFTVARPKAFNNSCRLHLTTPTAIAGQN